MSGPARATRPRTSLCTEAKAAGIGLMARGYPLGQASVDRYTSSGFLHGASSIVVAVPRCKPEQGKSRWTMHISTTPRRLEAIAPGVNCRCTATCRRLRQYYAEMHLRVLTIFMYTWDLKQVTEVCETIHTHVKSDDILCYQLRSKSRFVVQGASQSCSRGDTRY